MEYLLIAAVLVPTLVWLSAAVATAYGMLAIPRLASVPIDERNAWPRVTVVSPACNEDERVDDALRSVLALAYPELRIVAVDDRSTDRTGEILDELASSDPRLTALHVDHLPDGWLGKLNALRIATETADGEWLLFMDADTHLEAGTLRRAISYMDRDGVDFLSVLPQTRSAGWLGDAAFHVAYAMLCLTSRPWKIRDARSKAIAATGAFMLARKSVFDQTPGFEWLKLEVGDDFGLCLMMKEHGGRCDFLCGRGAVSLTWYASFREMSHAMQKNFFAITGRFSPARMTIQIAVLVWLALFPLLALSGPPWLLAAALAGLAMQIASAALGALWSGRTLAPSLLAPLGLLLTAYIVGRAAIVGVRQGGISWRGVLYPSELLKPAQRVKL